MRNLYGDSTHRSPLPTHFRPVENSTSKTPRESRPLGTPFSNDQNDKRKLCKDPPSVVERGPKKNFTPLRTLSEP